MKNNFFYTVFIYALLSACLVFSIYQLYIHFQKEKVFAQNYGQPEIKKSSNWPIRSIDTQIVSKHWQKVLKDSIGDQITLLKELGPNYIAIATPYDKLDELRNWVNEIHNQGMHVWFRSHWVEWEGADGKLAIMSPQEYLDKTYDFIISNPGLFKEGDAFTLAVEPEQVGVGPGRKFLTWDQYRDFIRNQIIYSNNAFRQIGLFKKVYTNWISVNGWIVDNVFDQKLVDDIQLIVVDHYSPQSRTVGVYDNPNKVAYDMSNDLDRFYKKWKVPIFIGEWGYQIYQDVPDQLQADMIEKVYSMLKLNPILLE